MKHQSAKDRKKNINQGIQLSFFLFLMLLTFYTICSRNDMGNIFNAVTSLYPFYFCSAAACVLCYVCAEGFMIWYLLHLTENRPRLLRCFGYSFIGFFFSGITPSATGGQPAQLVLMKKDKIPLGEATLTLMTVALLYKLVLVFIGIGLLLFWKKNIYLYMKSYIGLYYLGLFLNILLVILLLLFMFHGEWMEKLLLSIEKIGIRLRLFKPSEKRKLSFHQITADYQDTFRFFLSHKPEILFITFCTFLQRCCLFILTYFIYRAMGLSGYPVLTIILLQASIYIAVDMLPLPGSQGISELIYYTVFSSVFAGDALAASMCITRGISFYFPLILGGIMTCKNYLLHKKTY